MEEVMVRQGGGRGRDGCRMLTGGWKGAGCVIVKAQWSSRRESVDPSFLCRPSLR